MCRVVDKATWMDVGKRLCFLETLTRHFVSLESSGSVALLGFG